MADVEMYHPELDRVVSVRERMVPVLERSGWVRAETTDTFTDAQGRRYVAGKEVVQEVPETGEEEEE